MSTAQDLMLTAYQQIGYYAPSETMDASDSTLAQQQLTMMLDLWSNEALMTYAILEQSVQLVPGKAQYSIGTSGGADIVGARPIRVREGVGAAYLQDTNGNNYQVDVVTQARWNQLANRSSNTTSNIPDTLFYDPQMPLGLINLWPVPNDGSYKLFFDSFLQFTDISSLTQQIALPPGYEAAIVDGLSVRLWRFCYPGKPTPPDLLRQAMTSKATVKRSNYRNDLALFDSELMPRGQPTYNIYSDRWTAR